jgi:hypothetical protein
VGRNEHGQVAKDGLTSNGTLVVEPLDPVLERRCHGVVAKVEHPACGASTKEKEK